MSANKYPVVVDPGLTWQLQLAGEEVLHWKTQYTGFDPPLELPPTLTDDLATEFLRCCARYADKIALMNAGDYPSRPATIMYQYFGELAEKQLSNRLPVIISSARFNLNLFDEAPSMHLRSLTDYLFERSAVYRNLLPQKPQRYGGTKVEQKILHAKINAAKDPFKKQPSENWEEYFDRFLTLIAKDSQLSCVGFLKSTAAGSKPQYVEPWLLYTGESIAQLMDICSMQKAPLEVCRAVFSLKDAYESCGLNDVVQKIRAMAAPHRRQTRITYLSDRPVHRLGHIRLGGVFEDQRVFLHLDTARLE